MSDDLSPTIGRTALELADEAIDFADELRTQAERLETGTTIIDAGVAAPGSFDAGLLLATLRRGGLLAAEIGVGEFGGHTWPVLEATTSHPTLVAENATTQSIDELIVSGPALAGYVDPFAVAVVVVDAPIETEQATTIADTLDVDPDELYLVTISPGSIAWGVDAAADALESSITTLMTLGHSPEELLVEVPIPPTGQGVGDPKQAAEMCCTLGARVFVSVSEEIDQGTLTKLPVGESSPATVTISDERGLGTTVGERDTERLVELFSR